MRYLGIDYGDKRVGVAMSDETGVMAFPYSVLTNSKNLIEEILKIIEKGGVGEAVVGESLNMQGEPNVIQKDIDEFCANLKAKSKLKVALEPEFWTSAQAKSITGENKMHDASAAAIILQSYLDKKKNMV